MKSAAVRFMALVLLAALVAACAREERPEPEPEPAEPETRETQPRETDTVDPRDFSDPRNLDNPDSLLNKRLIYFDFDRSDVRPEFRDIVAAHAQYVRSNGTARVILEGHADERGSREYNLGLGERRGNSVSDLMQANGAGARQIEVVSYGEERPVCRTSDEECWQRNRRVEIVYTAR